MFSILSHLLAFWAGTFVALLVFCVSRQSGDSEPSSLLSQERETADPLAR